MASVQLLESHVADAIAAGEVIERPASVVKELVENALDAQARRINIDVRAAGQELIRVVDDGTGMVPEDVPTAFLRHATSKIRSLEDLHAIRSLGFRGEALPSIAAVARVECLTARAGSGGTRIRLEGGRQVALEPAGAAPGTSIEVRDLFYNTPARLKFLKKPATEAAAIGRLVGDLAIAYPDVAFVLSSDGRKTLQTPGSGQLEDAVHAVFGGEAATQLVPLSGDGPLRVSGAISQPRYDRASRDFILIYVNRRRIWNRSLTFAVEEAYRGLKDPGRFPLAIVLLEMDPATVDVNVHPTKREVRFQDEGLAFRAVQIACYEALREARPQAFQGSAPMPGADAANVPHKDPSAATGAGRALPGGTPLFLLTEEPPSIPPLRLLGQVLDSYLLCESPAGVVVVDQHAAHEKVLFNRFLGELAAGRRREQLLLIPAVIELTPALRSAFDHEAPTLRALGFEVEAFGGDTLRVTAAPAELAAESAAAFLERVLLELAEEAPAMAGPERLRKAAASLACHAAVKFHQALEPEEQRRLLHELEHTPDAITCPHGRPTVITLSDQQLRREFRRL
jgi:DNA mismatch repair protein MutL